MKLKTITHNIFFYPALILHELMHVIFALVCGLKIRNIFFAKITAKRFGGHVSYNGDGLAKNRFREVFVSFSPVLVLVSSIILLFVSLNTLPFFIYTLLTINMVFPSKGDFLRVFYFNELRKLHDSPLIDDEELIKVCDLKEKLDKLSLKEMIFDKQKRIELNKKLSKLN